jgi:signal transduction histidine kinase
MWHHRAGRADVGPPEGDDRNRVRDAGGVLAEVGNLVRIAAAVDRQREGRERDIRDGVQQRLAAMRIRLAVAGEEAGGDARLRGTIGEIGADLDEAIDELREVARGIHPEVLTNLGLAAALAHDARAAAGPVDVAGTGVGRYPGTVVSGAISPG